MNERDLAHEHDMEMLRREQLRADVSVDEADLEYREMMRLREEADAAEAYMGDPDEWDNE